ncbi:hypothetical protein CBW46_012800 [Paenibacillus xerothermodurans]|uniref:Carbohydrate ABC transporter permease n=1 Tax=Paenibacillus xerothermodurans TaxID=1977292 RepID=A0A2W1N8E3_PAEXE|nr:hypothetical protein CBW46_012800 [Paenibacillus xerothermodurans]
MKLRITIKRAVTLSILVAASVMTIYPVFYAISAAMMTTAEIDSFPPAIVPSTSHGGTRWAENWGKL